MVETWATVGVFAVILLMLGILIRHLGDQKAHNGGKLSREEAQARYIDREVLTLYFDTNERAHRDIVAEVRRVAELTKTATETINGHDRTETEILGKMQGVLEGIRDDLRKDKS